MRYDNYGAIHISAQESKDVTIWIRYRNIVHAVPILIFYFSSFFSLFYFSSQARTSASHAFHL